MSPPSGRKFTTFYDYISAADPAARKHLEGIRETVKRLVPDALEVISYNMPAFKYKGYILLYYAAHASHVGFYPANASLIDNLKEELTGYESSKGTIRFPLNRPLPKRLIEKIIRIRAEENLQKANAVKKKR